MDNYDVYKMPLSNEPEFRIIQEKIINNIPL